MTSANPCTSANNVFTTIVNQVNSGETGYYRFEECGDINNPTIGLIKGEKYEFIQKDASNWYHPMGFAWYVDGAHVDADELEPTIAPPNAPSGYSCVSTWAGAPPYLDCPAPRYQLDGAPITPASAFGEDFGLDDYEPRFFYPFADWVEQGTFSVVAPSVQNPNKVDPMNNDFFYFCHIHAGMSGRVKILDSDESVLSPPDVPEIPADYYQIQSEFDAGCGTYGISAFELPNPNCPVNFVCGAGSELKNFAACFNALDCAMTSGMSNEVGSQDADVSDEIALFINQMIPHHQNAVNMCKTLINQHLECAELTPDSAEEDIDCTMSLLCSEIINVQNHQIQTMKGIYGFESKSCSGNSSGNSAKKSKTAKGGKSDKSAKDAKAAKGGLKGSKAPKA